MTHTDNRRPLHMQSQPPTESWAGDAGNGVVTAVPGADGTLVVTASTGALTVPATTEGTIFKMDLLVTPVKRLNTAGHFRRDRYYQYGYNGQADCQAIGEMGVEVLNLHQGVMLNPYINYPFDHKAMASQANFSRSCKAQGVKATKIYYTTRELSNRCHEMPTLRLLTTDADAIFDHGSGGGGSWLQEHLQAGYHVRWSTGLADGEVDEAIADTSLSRWINYYLRGLQWLTEDHPETASIDGLYLDELSFDRNTMQRMRKAVDEKRSGCLFDLHSCNKFHCGVPSAPHACSALIYMAHFAYLDSLWYGEGFSPGYAPDQWLVEMSGIPYGLHAEQLSNPNLWRGMVFAEGARPAPALWKAWDLLQLTVDGVELRGWWEERPGKMPVVATNDTDVRASAYLRPSSAGGGIVIAVASWKGAGSGDARVTLAVDWDAIGIAADSAVVTAPSIAGFQVAATFAVDGGGNILVAVAGAEGWLIEVKAK